MAKSLVLKELWQLLTEEKKYWLLPVAFVLVLFGILLAVSETSAVTPFIYTLF